MKKLDIILLIWAGIVFAFLSDTIHYLAKFFKFDSGVDVLFMIGAFFACGLGIWMFSKLFSSFKEKIIFLMICSAVISGVTGAIGFKYWACSYSIGFIRDVVMQDYPWLISPIAGIGGMLIALIVALFPKIRFYLIFGVWPQDEEAIEVVQEELKSRALRFRTVCEDQFKINTLGEFDFKSLARRKVRRFKKGFWLAVAVAKEWGFKVGSSIKEY